MLAGMSAPTSLCAIVGVGPGLGLAIARRFGEAGLRVVLLARRADELAGHVADLRATGITAHAAPVDAADPFAIDATFAAIKAEHGAPDVLVYNAVASRPALPSALAPAALLDELRVNVGGALASVQAVLPDMRARGRGTVLLTGGGLGIEPMPRLASLSLGKAALRNLGLSLHRELAEYGLHVAMVTVCGFIRPGTAFDPENLAQHYWELHAQPREHWQAERVVR